LPDSPAPMALRRLRERYPTLLLMADVCLCAYTDHGHCGILHDDGTINNAASIARLAEVCRRLCACSTSPCSHVNAHFSLLSLQLAVFYADNGAHVCAPSDMMDGRIGAMKTALQASKLGERTAVMSYAAKFASCLYGPFREVRLM
jgi:porphobilinogen synthase